MPVLKNARHERFAQELAKGKCADEAYQAAGYKAHRGNASRMSSNESIMRRAEEIQSRAVERIGLSKQWVIERLIENANRAMQAVPVCDGDGPTGEYKYDGAVANKALELLGKEVGMFIDRAEIVSIVHAVSPELPTPDEWEREHVTEH